MTRLDWIMMFVIACILAISVNYMFTDLARMLKALSPYGGVI